MTLDNFDPDNDGCQTCKFWNSSKGETGFCRRYAPKPVQEILVDNTPAKLSYANWAITFDTDWCGEWQKK
jgi:hypothetical protein